MCPYVICTDPKNAALKRRTWSGKLFDSDLGYKPKSVYEQCGTAKASSLCSILSKINRESQLSPSTYDVEMIRKQLEAFRRANDFAKVTRQISPDEHVRFLDAYKQDIRSLRQYGAMPR